MGRKYFFKKYNPLLLQFLLFVVGIVGSVLSKGRINFKSMVLGGGSWFIPGLYFVWRMRRIKTTFDNPQMLKLFFSSEAIKLLLNFSMIAVILLTCNIDKKSFLGGYIFMIIISFIVPWRYGVKNG